MFACRFVKFLLTTATDYKSWNALKLGNAHHTIKWVRQSAWAKIVMITSDLKEFAAQMQRKVEKFFFVVVALACGFNGSYMQLSSRNLK